MLSFYISCTTIDGGVSDIFTHVIYYLLRPKDIVNPLHSFLFIANLSQNPTSSVL